MHDKKKPVIFLIFLRKIVFDLLFLCGCALLAYGFWLAWHPLGFIVGGALLAAVSFFVGYNRPAAVTGAESEQ
jgi:hypothetical protein